MIHANGTYYAALFCLATLLGGCGGSSPSPAEPPPPQPPALEQQPSFVTPSSPVIFMSRVIGDSPAVDDITVGANRWVQVRRLRGGAGARFDRFRLTRGEVRRLDAAMQRVAPRSSASAEDHHHFYYQLRVGHQQPYTYRDGRFPQRARTAMRLLEHWIATSTERAGH